MSDWTAALRQLRYPRELRIEAVTVPVKLPELDEVAALLEGMGETDASSALDPEFAVKVGNLTWRLRQRVGRLTDDSESTWLTSRLEMMELLLKTRGIEIRDYSGQPYDPDAIWDRVTGSEGRKLRPTIVRMKEPRILLDGVVIQRGTPVVEDGAATDGTES